MTPEEFDIDFDFDKEYGYIHNSGKNNADSDDFDLDAALARELGPDFDAMFEAEYAAAQAALNEAFNAPADTPAADDRDDLNETRLFSSFMQLDEDEAAEAEPAAQEDGNEDRFEDEDLSDFFAAAVNAAVNADSSPVPENIFEEDEPEAPMPRERRRARKGLDMGAIAGKVNLDGIREKVDFQAIGEKCVDTATAAGAVIGENARNFVDALRECKPGKMTKAQKRRFKNDVLPILLGAAALMLCMVFIVGAVVRSIGSEERQLAALQESIAQAEREEALAAEIRGILNTASLQAAGYDYQAAISTLDSFKTAERDLTDEMAAARAQYAATMTDLVIWDDPAAIANLSFHVLIEDTARAYADEGYSNSYRTKFITTEQFSRILDQLYENGYVLVNLDSCISETTGADGKTTYTTKPIYLPSGKTPIMITETLVNYFDYMTDGNGDGMPDAGGDGFASRLVISGGEIKAEYIDANGNTHVGNYDLVPILNNFIDAHPDFSYRGAKAILAVTGSEGIFGWRTNTDESLGSSVKDIAEVLRADGYQIASNSFANLDYSGRTTVDQINADLNQWKAKVAPILGDVDIMIIAKGSAIKTRGGGFTAMEEAGFHYIIDCTGTVGGELTSEYFHQHRIMVTGENLATDIYGAYFDLNG